ncbi:MAG: DUF370 domain-containing protein [Tissierellia bacterium]|nr:DUF370 domain-containing protein [Tissierellia bacterium]
MDAFINVGYGNFVQTKRIIAVISPDSAPIKRLIQNQRDKVDLVDATFGRRTRSVLFLDNRQIVLSALQTETMIARIQGMKPVAQEE